MMLSQQNSRRVDNVTTSTDTARPKWKQQWLIRRVVYIVLAIVGVVVAQFVDIAPERTDSWLRSADSILDIVLPIFLGVAAVKANPGSDSNLTETDVERADRLLSEAKKTETKMDDMLAQLGWVAARFKSQVDLIPVEEIREQVEVSKKNPNDENLSLDDLRDMLSRDDR